MESICGVDCEICEYGEKLKCKGCKETAGCPFNKKCFIAKYMEVGGKESFDKLKKELIDEFNLLNVDGMPKINELFPLNGSFVNLEYPLLNGGNVKFLDDDEIYLGNQVECEFNDGEVNRCFGLVANMNFLLVSEYGEDGINPEIVIYKRR